jgi:hypothetical protein
MSVVAVLFACAAAVIVFFGAGELTQATTGVGLICIGCFVGILARLAQASAHHAAMMARDPQEHQPIAKSGTVDPVEIPVI